MLQKAEAGQHIAYANFYLEIIDDDSGMYAHFGQTYASSDTYIPEELQGSPQNVVYGPHL